MSDKLPDIIYAALYAMNNDSGVWFDKPIEDDLDMTLEPYYSQSKVDELLEQQKRLLVLATKHCPSDHHDFKEIIEISHTIYDARMEK